jgi:hypothetical protein
MPAPDFLGMSSAFIPKAIAYSFNFFQASDSAFNRAVLSLFVASSFAFVAASKALFAAAVSAFSLSSDLAKLRDASSAPLKAISCSFID